MTDAEEIKKYIAATFGEGDILNLRYKLRNGKAANRAFKAANADAIIKEIERAEKTGVKDAGKEPVAYWVNCQHVRPEFLDTGRESITDNDVDAYVMLPLDFDADKPADAGVNSNSTEEEKQAAYNRMSVFRDAARRAGWPEPIVVDSGNGGQLRYRCSLPAGRKELVQALLKAVADNFGGDPGLFNPSRVLKLPGTMTRKGTANTPERPHRMSRVLSYPEQWTPVPEDLIVALLKMYPPKEEPRPGNGAAGKPGDKSSMVDTVRRWLREWKVPVLEEKTNGTTTYMYIPDSYCCNAREHTSNSNAGTTTCVIVTDKIGYNCQHGHCTMVKWTDFRAYHDPAYARNKAAPETVRDTPIAEWVYEHYETNLLYVVRKNGEGEFYVYNGRYLEVDNQRASRRFMEQVAKDLVDAYDYQASLTPATEPVTYPDGNPVLDDDGLPKMRATEKFKEAMQRREDAKKYLDVNKQRDLWELIKNRVASTVKEFNRDKNIMAVENGVIDLSMPLNVDGSRRLLDHDPKYRLTMMAPVKYVHGATCPRFMEHVVRAFPTPEEQRYTRYIFGGALQRVMRKDCSHIYFFGRQDTGKSTIALCVAETLGTDIKSGYAITRNSSFNSEKNARKETRDDLLQTRDKMLILIDEVRSDERQDAEAIKSGPGGASKNARGLFNPDEQLEDTATTINTCNKLPPLPWEDPATVSRLVLAEFTKQIINPDKSKPVFKDIVAAEASGILNWLLEGDYDARTNGPPPKPERLTKTVERMAENRDVLGQYINAYYVFGDKKHVDNRTPWNRFASGVETYYTLNERTQRRYIPQRQSILEALKHRGVEITNNKTRVRGEQKPVRGVLLGIRPKNPGELEAEDVEAWMRDEEDTVKTVGAAIVEALAKENSKSLTETMLATKLGVPSPVIQFVAEQMTSKHLLDRDAVGDIALPNRKN